MEIDDRLAYKIHGLIDSDSDSDDDDYQMEFDEEYYLLKPPPFVYESIKHQVILKTNDSDVKKGPESEKKETNDVFLVAKKKKKKSKSKKKNDEATHTDRQQEPDRSTVLGFNQIAPVKLIVNQPERKKVQEDVNQYNSTIQGGLGITHVKLDSVANNISGSQSSSKKKKKKFQPFDLGDGDPNDITQGETERTRLGLNSFRTSNQDVTYFSILYGVSYEMYAQKAGKIKKSQQKTATEPNKGLLNNSSTNKELFKIKPGAFGTPQQLFYYGNGYGSINESLNQKVSMTPSVSKNECADFPKQAYADAVKNLNTRKVTESANSVYVDITANENLGKKKKKFDHLYSWRRDSSCFHPVEEPFSFSINI